MGVYNSVVLLPLLPLFVFLWTRLRSQPNNHVRKLQTPSDMEYVWGHERKVFFGQPGQFFRLWTEQLGLAYRIKAAFGAPDILVLSDPVGIAHILQRRVFDYRSYFRSLRVHRHTDQSITTFLSCFYHTWAHAIDHSNVVRPRIARFLGKGLGWVEGESEHRRMKRLVSFPLRSESIKAMSGEVRNAASRVISDFHQFCSSQKDTKTAEPINILQWTAKATLSVVGRAAFCHDFDGGNNPDAVRILNARRQGVIPIIRYAAFLTLMLLRRFSFLNSLPIPAIQSQSIAKDTIKSGVAKEMVRRNKELYSSSQLKEGKDLLSILIQAETEGRISTEELFEQITTFIMTGHEATTLTLGFTIWELSRNQTIQQKLRDELQSFSAEPTYDDFQYRLPYLDAILKETLRLYPGLPYMERVSTKDDIIPLSIPIRTEGGECITQIEIKPGQTVLVPIIAIQRASSVWGDADVFRPERWLEELPPQEELCSGWNNLLAFSDGPRSCIGAKLAIFQYKVIISELITSFKFTATDDQLTLKISSSIQPYMVGKEREGPQLPVYACAL